MKSFYEIYRNKINTTPCQCSSDAEKIFCDSIEEYINQAINEKVKQ